MDRVKPLIRTVCFLALFAVLLYAVQWRIMPKWDYPTDGARVGKAVSGVYLEPENTLDVLWIGTSHMQNAASPMVVYRDSGIRSYNLATTGQPLLGSYYRLKSVLKRQSPKLVIMDVGYVFSASTYQKNETAWRKLIDSLPFNRTAEKLEMTKALVSLNSDEMDMEDIYSGVMPILRYHTNYTLDRIAYIDVHRDEIYPVKGQACIITKVSAPVDTWAQDGNAGKNKENAVITKRLQQNLDSQTDVLMKIKDLCEQNGCELMFTKVPVNTTRAAYSGYWDQEKHDMIASLAESMGVKYVDLNYEDVGIDWKLDTCDGGQHLNVRGAEKFSKCFAQWLKNNYSFEDAASPQLANSWDEQLRVYEKELDYSYLQSEHDIATYLNRLKAGNYTVFTAVMETIGGYWSEDLQALLNEVTGSGTDLYQKRGDGFASMAYVSASSNGKSIDEAIDKKTCGIEGKLDDGTSFAVKSNYTAKKSSVSILVNGQERATTGRGICMVVYDNDLHCVVDSVSFDTELENRSGKHTWGFLRPFREVIADYESDTLKDL